MSEYLFEQVLTAPPVMYKSVLPRLAIMAETLSTQELTTWGKVTNSRVPVLNHILSLRGTVLILVHYCFLLKIIIISE